MENEKRESSLWSPKNLLIINFARRNVAESGLVFEKKSRKKSKKRCCTLWKERRKSLIMIMGSATLVAVKWRRNRRARNCKVSQLFESSLWRGVGGSRNRWGHERIPPPPFLSKFAVVYRLDRGGRCLGWKNNGSWTEQAPWLRCTEIWLCSRTDLRLELCWLER